MIVPKKLPKDSNQRAFEIVRISTGQVDAEIEAERSPESKHMAEIGSKGGKKGGRARKRRLSAMDRSAIATKAARARWDR